MNTNEAIDTASEYDIAAIVGDVLVAMTQQADGAYAGIIAQISNDDGFVWEFDGLREPALRSYTDEELIAAAISFGGSYECNTTTLADAIGFCTEHAMNEDGSYECEVVL